MTPDWTTCLDAGLSAAIATAVVQRSSITRSIRRHYASMQARMVESEYGSALSPAEFDVLHRLLDTPVEARMRMSFEP